MPDIRHSISISAPADRVRSLVSSAAGFSQWWAEDSLQKDGLAELGFFSRQTIYKLRPINAPDEVLWRCESGKEWEGTTLSFRCEPAANGCTLHFVHGDWKHETPYFTSCNTTWGGLMFRLKAAAEGKQPGPLFTAGAMAY